MHLERTSLVCIRDTVKRLCKLMPPCFRYRSLVYALVSECLEIRSKGSDLIEACIAVEP